MHKSNENTGALVTRQTRGRGRPRAFNREQALAKAMKLFWRRGYEATSIADITEELGIGSPSLYAAFGSKEELYTEALQHYGKSYQDLAWAGFFAASTARKAVRCFLMDSAAALSGSHPDLPLGCMVTLSAIDSQSHAKLGELVRAARATTLERIEVRLERALAEGELSSKTDVHALARFVQTVQSGMSVLARDKATRAELESVAEVALLAWNARARS